MLCAGMATKQTWIEVYAMCWNVHQADMDRGVCYVLECRPIPADQFFLVIYLHPHTHTIRYESALYQCCLADEYTFYLNPLLYWEVFLTSASFYIPDSLR